MKSTVAKRSKAQNYQRSRLLEFTTEEINLTKGTLDFIGLNHYGSNSAAHDSNPSSTTTGYFDDMEIISGSIEDGVTMLFFNIAIIITYHIILAISSIRQP